jgi:hypothetical protein
MAFRRFAVAGLVPGGLVGWELFAYGRQRQKYDAARKARPKPLVEGSTAWLIERDAQTLDLVCVRHKALDRGPAAALADAAARIDPTYPYDAVGVVVVERDGVSRVLRADLDGTVTAMPLARLLREHGDFAEVALVPLLWNDDDREVIAAPARRFFAEALLRCGGTGAPRFAPWAALRDARVAPLLLPRASWPRASASRALDARLRDAVSPAAALALQALAACDVVAPQYVDGCASVPADLLAGRVPLRRGARYAPERRVDVVVGNAVAAEA